MQTVCVLAIAILVAGSSLGQISARVKSTVDELLAEYGVSPPTPLYRKALDTFVAAETAYRRGDYRKTDELLRLFWNEHPPGTTEWVTAYSDAWRIQRTAGLNVGAPPCYYALRMLTECVRWRLSSSGTRKPTATVILTVILVERSRGLEPRTKEEFEKQTGTEVVHVIEPALTAKRSAILRESLWLFQEYMRAATDGRLQVRASCQRLSDLELPVTVRDKPLRFAGLGDGAWQLLWKSVPERVKATTDWWWVIYPSAVPEKYPDFQGMEFITGGMGTGPDGLSPCFIIDDRWLTRKPPHLGKGPYSSLERRSYLPQWLQHEFFHHLFRTYPEFGLEARSHQWFDRSTWPTDFVGSLEPDYYDEALQKRLKPLGSPPMHVALRYAPPPTSLFRKVRLMDLAGTYVHQPVENDWHVGTLEVVSEDDKPRIKWTNRAGVSWFLYLDLQRGLLRTGPDCPYYDPRHSEASAFRLKLMKDENGRWQARVIGFVFQGGLYKLTADPQNAAP